MDMMIFMVELGVVFLLLLLSALLWQLPQYLLLLSVEKDC